MSNNKGTRSRQGCFNCRKRKRRCDQTKPVCLSCTKIGSRCEYPSATTPLKFVISLSPGHYTIPVANTDARTPFLNLTSHDVATIGPALHDLESNQHDHALDGAGDELEDSRLEVRSNMNQKMQAMTQRPLSLQLFSGSDAMKSIQFALLQYCQLIFPSHPTVTNKFQTSKL